MLISSNMIAIRLNGLVVYVPLDSDLIGPFLTDILHR